ncbi:MAG: CPBP family intramembrane metalloprotease [Bacteroidales bacterium]|nr:CPBP family intramembrane metalloprotease [Bacteroidales bacterium]
MTKQFPSINQAFMLILLLILISIPAAIPSIGIMILADSFMQSPVLSENLKSFGVLFSYVLTMFWIIKIAQAKIKKIHNINVQWKFKKLPYQLIFIFFIMTLALVILTDPLTELLPPMPKIFEDMFKEMIKPNIFSFLTIVIAAPVFEELFFRGIVLEGFLKNYSPRKAIIWSAVIFGSAHLNPWQFVGAGFAGLFIGWAYYKTGSLIPGIFIHFINNLISFVVGVWSKGELLTFYELFSDKMVYWAMFIMSLIIIFVGVFAINRQYLYPVKESMN